MPAPVDTSDPFRALSDPKRRAILDVLAAGPLPVRAIASHFPEISRPAVSKHLRMLLEGGLVQEERSGRERYYSIVREALDGARAWLEGVGLGTSPQASASAGRSSAAASPRRDKPVASPRRRPRPSPERRRQGGAPSPRPDAESEVGAEADDWRAW